MTVSTTSTKIIAGALTGAPGNAIRSGKVVAYAIIGTNPPPAPRRPMGVKAVIGAPLVE